MSSGYPSRAGKCDEDSNRTPLPSADLEPDAGHESVGKKEAKGLDSRVDITVTSYRNRNHDPDGVSVKAVLDGLVRAGFLPDDSAKEIKSITFESIKSKEEKTVITITE